VVDQTAEEIAAADAWIERMFGFVVPSEDDEVTLEWVLERCATAIVRHGARLLIVDPWNEMDHIRPADMSLTEYTGFAIKQFRRLAKKHLVHVIVAAHPTKQRKLDSGDYAIPSLYDISDSAHWYNRADVGIIVHRTTKCTTIRIAKSRHHDEIGEPGDVEATFNRMTGRYEIADTEEAICPKEAWYREAS
jgi:twinkle protein